MMLLDDLGLLRAAIAAGTECMFNNLFEGAANFRIVDGGNVIGTGTIE